MQHPAKLSNTLGSTVLLMSKAAFAGNKKNKKKLRNMKEAYKKVKHNNSQTGTSLVYPPFYIEFKEILGSRDVINLKYVKEVGAGLSPANIDEKFATWLSHPRPQ